MRSIDLPLLNSTIETIREIELRLKISRLSLEEYTLRRNNGDDVEWEQKIRFGGRFSSGLWLWWITRREKIN